MSAPTLTRTLARTSAGRVIGGCNTCGTGISIAGMDRNGDITVMCPGCNSPVRLAMVSGRMSDEDCNTLCLFAVGPDCVCGCGGDNHGSGFSVVLVPTWIRTDAAPYPTVTAPNVPAHITARNAARITRTATRAAEKAATLAATAAAYRTELFTAHPELEKLTGERFADSDSEFVRDMRDKIRDGADMSPRMISACVRVVESTLARDARRVAADAARTAATASGVRVEPGRQVITGEIEWLDMNAPNPFVYNGTRAEVTVRDASGRRYKGTFPRGLEPAWSGEIAEAYIGWPDRARGQRVTIIGTVKPSDRDPLLGFFSSPTVPKGTPTLSHIGHADQAPDSSTPAVVAPARTPRQARCRRNADPPACQHTPGCFPTAPVQPATVPATPAVESFLSGW